MSTFNDFIEAFKEVCDRKDEEIQKLQDRIDGLINERKSIRDAFNKGDYENLKWYFNG